MRFFSILFLICFSFSAVAQIDIEMNPKTTRFHDLGEFSVTRRGDTWVDLPVMGEGFFSASRMIPTDSGTHLSLRRLREEATQVEVLLRSGEKLRRFQITLAADAHYLLDLSSFADPYDRIYLFSLQPVDAAFWQPSKVGFKGEVLSGIAMKLQQNYQDLGRQQTRDDLDLLMFFAPTQDSSSSLKATNICQQAYRDCRNMGGSPQECQSEYEDCDTDFDGVPNIVDNCVYRQNPDQSDCDGDGIGDLCDSQNANYVNIEYLGMCEDKDTHFGYITLEYYHVYRQRDYGCGNQDRLHFQFDHDEDCELYWMCDGVGTPCGNFSL